MGKRLLDWDPVSQMATWHTYDEKEDKTYISYEQDVNRNLDFSKEMQANPDYMRAGIKNNRMHAAHIPASVALIWLTEHGVDVHNKHHMPAVKRLLNSREYAYLKTIPGRV